MTTEAFAIERVENPWWLFLLEGITATILGILLFMAPGMSLLVLVTFTGFFWLVRGVFYITSIFVDNSAWGWKLFAGFLGVIAGIAVLRHPLWSALLLPATVAFLLGIQGVIVGIISLIFAFRGGGWGAGVVGLLNLIIGVVLMLNPLISGVTLVFVIGGFAVVGGILAIVTAFQLRKAQV
jgi:uncharacterized membrane protein HdeD (DUF308 family)